MALSGKDLGALIGQMGMDMSDWEKAFDRMDKDMMNAQRQADTMAKKISRSFDKTSERLGSIGKTMTTRVTLPIVGAGAASLKMAGDFDKSMRLITGLVGVAADKVEAMKGNVLGLAGETARSPQELAEALFFVTSAGFRGQEALDVLEMSAKAAAAGLGETKAIADLVTSAINAYGAENLSAATATDVLTAAVREGKLEAQSLAPVMGGLLPLATELGISFDELAGFLAAMSRTGLDANRAATALRGIMVKFLRPSQQGAEKLKQFELNAADLRNQIKEGGLLTVLRTLSSTFEGNEEAMGRVFEDVEGLIGVLNILGQDADTVTSIMEGTANAAGDLENAFNAAQGPAFKFDQALSKLKIAAINLGTALFPIFEQMIDLITPMLDKLTSLEEGTLKWGVAIGGLAAFVGPALLLLSKLAAAMSFLLTPMGAIVAGLGVLALAIYSKWDDITRFFSKEGPQFMQPILEALENIRLSFVRFFDVIGDLIQTRIQFYGDLWSEWGGFLLTTLQGVFVELVNILGIGLEALSVSLDVWSGRWLSDWDGFLEDTKSSFENVFGEGGFLQNTFDSWFQRFLAQDPLVQAGNWISSLFGLDGPLQQASQEAQNQLDASGEAMVNSLEETLAEWKSKLSGFSFEFPSFGGGGGETLSDMGQSGLTGGAGEGFKKFSDRFKHEAAGIAASMSQMVGSVETDAPRFNNALDSMKKGALDMSDALQSSITSAATSFATSIGQMIASGVEGGSFFDMLLKLTADFAVQFGKIIISMGVAALSLQRLLLTPWEAIAAGAALVALGTALKGLVAKGPGGGGASATVQGPVARTVSERGQQVVVFRMHGKELLGVMQEVNRGDRRTGRQINVNG